MGTMGNWRNARTLGRQKRMPVDAILDQVVVGLRQPDGVQRLLAVQLTEMALMGANDAVTRGLLLPGSRCARSSSGNRCR
jgi:hypothetical protein